MAANSFADVIFSSIGKKIIMALSGLFLVVFVLVHMVGNLSFVFAGSDAFNLYSYQLISLGPLLWAIEAGLLATFIFHAYFGISVSANNRSSRPSRYAKSGSAGGDSRKSSSSISMIYTGIVLLIFLVIHLWTFKYGTYYSTTVNSIEMRDLYRLVAEKFASPVYTFGYLGTMLLLGLHLRHGFWSAFQSLGANHPRYSNIIYAVGVILAITIAFGFTAVPLQVYFFF